MKVKKTLTVFLCIAILATAIPVYAEEQNPIQSLIDSISKSLRPLAWWLPAEKITVTGNTITFWSGHTNGLMWYLANENGAIVNQRSVGSYGYYTIGAPGPGKYKLYCTISGCDAGEWVTVPSSQPYISPMVTPIVTPMYGTPTPSPTSQTGGGIKFIPDVFVNLWNAFFGWLKGIF
jgi:hypothetical protein